MSIYVSLEYCERLESRIKSLEEKWKSLVDIHISNRTELINDLKQILLREEKVLTSFKADLSMGDDDSDLSVSTADKDLGQYHLHPPPLSPAIQNFIDDVTGSSFTQKHSNSSNSSVEAEVAESFIVTDKRQDSEELLPLETQDIDLEGENSNSIREINLQTVETGLTQIQTEAPSPNEFEDENQTEKEMGDQSNGDVEEEDDNGSVTVISNQNGSGSPHYSSMQISAPAGLHSDSDQISTNLASVNVESKDEPLDLSGNVEIMLDSSQFKRNNITVTTCEVLRPQSILVTSSPMDVPMPDLTLMTSTICLESVDEDISLNLMTTNESPSCSKKTKVIPKVMKGKRKNQKRVPRKSSKKSRSCEKVVMPEKEKKNRVIAVATLECPICGNKLRSPTGLKAHMRSHEDIRPHKCNHCDATFRQKFTLNRHLLIHTGERRFQCTICLKKFPTNSEMVSHFKRHARQALKCPTCSKQFLDRRYFKTHLKVCSSPSSTKCPQCGKMFKDPKYLDKHVKSCCKVE